jgi:release factor glutamine methyltransferase
MIADQLLEHRAEIITWIDWAAGHLARNEVPSPRFDAEALLTSILGCRRHELYLDPGRLGGKELESFQSFIFRRGRREPLQYILGEAAFYGRLFKVNQDVLIPRPETELLLERVLRDRNGPQRIIDVGTGSGCLAVSLACEIADARVLAIDNSPAALALARQNALRHGVSERVGSICGNLLNAVRSSFSADLVVANLPYIPEDDLDGLQAEVARFEPRSALDGGADGLFLIRRLIADVLRVLDAGGLLALEIGHDQGTKVESMVNKLGAFSDTEVLRDHAGLSRMFLAVKRA